MTQAGDKPVRQPVLHTDEERAQIDRFVKAINQAMVVNGLSQRGLCNLIGVKVGTLTKYLRGEVAPMKVGIGIQSALAEVLGVTTDALLGYYRNEEYLTAVTLDQVESWIRSDAGQEDFPVIMASLQAASQRLVSGEAKRAQQEEEDVLQPWDWPQRELEEAQLSERFLERNGLTEERIAALVERGEYDEDLVEAFSVACNYELDAVREAFRTRQAIA